MTEASKPRNPRRGFLKVVGATGAVPFAHALTVGAVAAEPLADAKPEPLTASKVVGYTCFSPIEAAFVEQMVNVMCPADTYTPNGVDCGLAIYIDRQLGGGFGKGAGRYTRGPWQPGRPELGDQSPMTPEQSFKAGIAAANLLCVAKYGSAFDQIKSTDAEAFLQELAAGQASGSDLSLALWFDQLVYPLFEQACFADPIYGGNVDKIFWKMIGYPGLPATHATHMIQYRGKPFPGSSDPKSIADFS